MKKLLVFLVLTALILSCNTTEPLPPGTNITLKTEDVSSIEAWIKITTNNIQLPAEVTLKKNNTVEQTISLLKQDSIIYLDSLLPKTTYNFQAIIQSSNLPAGQAGQSIKSNELSVTTMDTTSQNFTFETLEFGDGYSSSYFNDVWIFDENNIWAVGYISPEDTTINGTHITNPNIIKRDGTSWKLQPYSGTSSGIYGIWAFDSSNIYFANGAIVKYENGQFIETDLGNLGFTNGQGVEKLWGSGLDNIWGIGPWGTIVHFDGQSWSKIDFDTQWRFDDITGNPGNGFAYASATNQSFNTIIVELKNNSTDIIYNSALTEEHLRSFSLSFVGKEFIYLGNDKVWRFNIRTKKTESLFTLPVSYGVLSIAAYEKNDIYFFGDRLPSSDELIHYNGKSFTIINYADQLAPILGSSAIKDFANVVGFINNKAYLVKVKRN